MTLVKNIGKNTLGDNNKMSVRLHAYNMSNHDLSFVFRNTQSPGTLVPFIKIIAQKGDVFDIQLINKTLTAFWYEYELTFDAFLNCELAVMPR